MPEALPADDIRIHRGAYVGDFDNDGRLDLLTTATDDRPTLLHNDSKAGSWLRLKLIARNGCATPIGARCTVTVAGKQHTRWVIGGGSYAGDSDSRVHLGLGAAQKLDRLEVRWPSGKLQTLTDLALNKEHIIREP